MMNDGVADDMDGEDMDEDEDEGQHHPDDDDEDLEDGQELFQLDQLEQMPGGQRQTGQQVDDMEDRNLNLDSLGDLGQAAQQLGLDEDGLRALEMQKRMYDQRQMYEGENLDYGEGEIEGVVDSENQEGMEMEMRIQNEQDGGMDGEDDDEAEHDLDSDVKEQILRGGQNIEDDQSPYGQEQEDGIDAMAEQIKQINE